MKKRYIKNDKKFGLKIEWTRIFDMIEKENLIPSERYFKRLDFTNTAWNILMSGRSVGKTTTFLLIALMLYREYGIKTMYLRENNEMTRQKSLESLFDTIEVLGLISKIFGDKWNAARLRAGKWYLQKVEDGELKEESEDYFMRNLSLDRTAIYKSSLVEPFGDLIIFDEFISKYYMRGDFGDLLDLIKTIKRDRLSTVVVMLANTTEVTSEYFDELQIREYIEKMTVGQSRTVTTEQGTNIYIEFIENKRDKEEKNEEKEKFFGFKNAKVKAIDGTDWVFNEYPHYVINRTRANTMTVNEIIQRGFFVKTLNKYYAVDIARSDLGICAIVHNSNAPDERLTNRVYTLDFLSNQKEIYALGTTVFDKWLWGLYFNGKFLYANNTCGNAIENYVRQAKLRGR